MLLNFYQNRSVFEAIGFRRNFARHVGFRMLQKCVIFFGSREVLQNIMLAAKIGFDTTENGLSKVCGPRLRSGSTAVCGCETIPGLVP